MTLRGISSYYSSEASIQLEQEMTWGHGDAERKVFPLRVRMQGI
ncbi:hypothetical protein [Chroococcidiopsis sp. CCMEE 29]|nr:hypothetical protein [Chroococcidiopsis sp. CCMEE 29]